LKEENVVAAETIKTGRNQSSLWKLWEGFKPTDKN
jgi:hypothetical protein